MGYLKRKIELYTGVILGDKLPGDDLEDCLKFTCTNKRTLSEYSGISYHRLTYVFTILKKTYLHEGGIMIIKTHELHKGKQTVTRNGGLIGFNRNI